MMGPWAPRLGGLSPAGPMESAPMTSIVGIFPWIKFMTHIWHLDICVESQAKLIACRPC